MRSPTALASVSLAASLLASEPARCEPARGEPRLWVGAGPSVLVLDRPPYEKSVGPGFHLGLRAPLNDQFELVTELDAGAFSLRRAAPDPCPDPPAPCESVPFPYKVWAVTAGVGAMYVLDVTHVRPSFGAMLTGMRLGAGDSALGALQGQRALEQHIGATLLGAVDYRLTERWSAGVFVRLFYSSSADLSSFGLQAQWAAF